MLKLLKYLDKKSPLYLLSLASILITVIGIIDHVTGPEFPISIEPQRTHSTG